MSSFRELLRRVSYLFNRRRHQAALADEMAEHRARMAEPARFGNVLHLREQSQDAWGWRWLDDAARDVRIALRLILRSPGYAAVVVGSLLIAFVLVVCVTVSVNAYLLRPLPYGGGDRLYHVQYAPPGPWEPSGLSALDWTSVRDVVEYPITSGSDTFYLEDGAYSQPARVVRASPGFVAGLEVRATYGRVLDERDWRPDADRVAMIGYGLWRDRYASDPGIIGKVIRAAPESRRGESETVRVIGVLPANFYFGRDSTAKVDLIVPLRQPVRTYLVRLRAGVPADVAERRLTDAARLVSNDIPPTWTGVRLESVRARYVAGVKPILTGVGATIAVILLVVSANVAVLTLLRVLKRTRELAVRTALGAGRFGVARLLALETALLVGSAVVLGLATTIPLLRVLRPVIEARLGRPAPGGPDAMVLDGTVVLIVGVIAAAVAIALAFLPALGRWRRDGGDVLTRDRQSSTDSRPVRRLRSALLVSQIAVTLVLVVAGGLLLQSLRAMTQSDLGFAPDGLSRSRFVLRAADYSDGPSFHRFFQQFAASASARVNGSVAYSSWPPFVEHPELSVETPSTAGSGVDAGYLRVSGGYFTTMGVEIRNGRDMNDTDVRDNAAVAIVSQALADRLWRGQDAIGREIRGVEQTQRGQMPGPWRTVVGVVADVRQGYVDTETADIYFPQDVASIGRYGNFYIRTDRSVGELWPLLRSAAAEIDKNAIVNEPVRVASENLELAGARFLSQALGITAIGALGLAVLGIYGVTAFVVSQRAREIALRLALGAGRQNIQRQFLGQAARVLAAGAIVGVVAVFALARFARSWLYGLPPTDGLTLVAASAVVAVAGLGAAWGPIRRASRANPTAALKDV
jgi:putative ABC transport system permease protein